MDQIFYNFPNVVLAPRRQREGKGGKKLCVCLFGVSRPFLLLYCTVQSNRTSECLCTRMEQSGLCVLLLDNDAVILMLSLNCWFFLVMHATRHCLSLSLHFHVHLPVYLSDVSLRHAIVIVRP